MTKQEILEEIIKNTLRKYALEEKIEQLIKERDEANEKAKEHYLLLEYAPYEA